MASLSTVAAALQAEYDYPLCLIGPSQRHCSVERATAAQIGNTYGVQFNLTGMPSTTNFMSSSPLALVVRNCGNSSGTSTGLTPFFLISSYRNIRSGHHWARRKTGTMTSLGIEQNQENKGKEIKQANHAKYSMPKPTRQSPHSKKTCHYKNTSNPGIPTRLKLNDNILDKL